MTRKMYTLISDLDKVHQKEKLTLRSRQSLSPDLLESIASVINKESNLKINQIQALLNKDMDDKISQMDQKVNE